jgi:hypothetical protein
MDRGRTDDDEWKKRHVRKKIQSTGPVRVKKKKVRNWGISLRSCSALDIASQVQTWTLGKHQKRIPKAQSL